LKNVSVVTKVFTTPLSTALSLKKRDISLLAQLTGGTGQAQELISRTPEYFQTPAWGFSSSRCWEHIARYISQSISFKCTQCTDF
jgi:hypothetical protein